MRRVRGSLLVHFKVTIAYCITALSVTTFLNCYILRHSKCSPFYRKRFVYKVTYPVKQKCLIRQSQYCLFIFLHFVKKYNHQAILIKHIPADYRQTMKTNIRYLYFNIQSHWGGCGCGVGWGINNVNNDLLSRSLFLCLLFVPF